MKVAFVDLLHLFNDPHGICAMSAVLKQNDMDVSFIGTRNFTKALKRIEQIQPDVLLYSAFSATIPTYILFDRKVKETRAVQSVIGGPGPTYDWERIKSSTIDAICVGEGEYAIVDFLNRGFKCSKNIFRPGDPLPKDFFPLADLNNMPFPDRTVVYDVDSLLAASPSKQFLSGRGCPFACTYCFNHQFRDMFKGCGPSVRKKSVDYMLAEIKEVKARYPLEDIVFNDDTFIIDKKWFLEFAERFPREVGISYTCNVRGNLVDDDIVKALKKSGCRGVNWSIESGNDFIRNKVLKRGMTDEQIYETARILHQHDVTFRIGNMLGLPGESFKQMLETVEMNIKVRPKFALSNIFVPFPGLELTDYAIENGFCSKEVIENLPKDYFSKCVMNIPEEEKTRIYKLFCLFEIFVAFPNLFNNQKIREFLFHLPRVILRFLHEVAYTWFVSRFYTPKAPFLHKCRMAKRYLLNL